jgi:hypothetical protein
MKRVSMVKVWARTLDEIVSYAPARPSHANLQILRHSAAARLERAPHRRNSVSQRGRTLFLRAHHGYGSVSRHFA